MGKTYYAHRLAFWFGHGRMPEIVDHINGCKYDNRLLNLREVTASQNNLNQGVRSDNKSGFKGVQYDPSHKKWRSRIKMGDQYKILGYFDTAREAGDAFREASLKVHGSFARAE